MEITQRFGNAKLPQLIAVDVRKEKRDRKLHGDFTSLLTQQIEKVFMKEIRLSCSRTAEVMPLIFPVKIADIFLNAIIAL